MLPADKDKQTLWVMIKHLVTIEVLKKALFGVWMEAIGGEKEKWLECIKVGIFQVIKIFNFLKNYNLANAYIL